ncbi:hypothetical protein K0U83_16705 [bacterium]|nr:hypothetical protein [bacterium]
MKQLAALAIAAMGLLSVPAFAQGTGGVATGGSKAGSTATTIQTGIFVATGLVIGLTVEAMTGDDEPVPTEGTPGTGGGGTTPTPGTL